MTLEKIFRNRYKNKMCVSMSSAQWEGKKVLGLFLPGSYGCKRKGREKDL